MNPTTSTLDDSIVLAEQSASLYRLAERKNGPSASLTSQNLQIAALLTRLYLARPDGGAMPALIPSRDLREGVRRSRTARRPCDTCAYFKDCEAADIACQDFAAWVLLNQHRSLRREPTPGMFDLIFERENAALTSDLMDQTLHAEIVREAKRKARVDKDLEE